MSVSQDITLLSKLIWYNVNLVGRTKELSIFHKRNRYELKLLEPNFISNNYINKFNFSQKKKGRIFQTDEEV